MKLTPENLAELRANVSALSNAYPEGWTSGHYTFKYKGMNLLEITDGEPEIVCDEITDHIAAFDPPTCLALLDALAEKDAEIARLGTRLNTAALRADNLITSWEMAHGGKLIFGEVWRKRLGEKIDE